MSDLLDDTGDTSPENVSDKIRGWANALLHDSAKLRSSKLSSLCCRTARTDDTRDAGVLRQLAWCLCA